MSANDDKPEGGLSVDLNALLEAEIERRVAQRLLGIPGPPLSQESASSFTVDDAIALHAKVRLPKQKKGGRATVQSKLRAVSRILGKKEVLDLSHDVLDEYMRERQETVSESTAGQELIILAGVMKVAMKRGRIPYSPLHGYEITLNGRKRSRVYTDEEIDALLDAAVRCKKPAIYAVISVMRETGIRPLELITTRKADFDWATGSLYIRREVAKTGLARWCVVWPAGIEALKAISKPDSPWLFPPLRGKANKGPMGKTTLNAHWLTIRDVAMTAPDADGTPAELYSLRGTLATRLGLNEGYEITRLMAAMGWTNPKQAEDYVRTGERQMQEEAAKRQAADIARKLTQKRPPATVTNISSVRKKAE